MTKLLYILASPRGESSQSNLLAEAFIEEKRASDSELVVSTLDLWKADLPEFDGDKAAAKMTFFGVGDMDDGLKTEWTRIEEIAAQVMDADHIVFAVPMWNGGVPYKLKQYIDIITQPGLLFGFSPEQGYFGLLENKKASVFYTSGVFFPGAEAKYGSDFHSTYLSWWLNMIGISDIESVCLQPSLVTSDPEQDFQSALSKAKNLAL